MNPLQSTAAAADVASPARRVAAIALGIGMAALVFALIDVGVARLALARFPDPAQALVWSRIGGFLAMLLALGAGVETAWLVWRARRVERR
ncbi:MAG: hypothetical protein KF903_12210 [Dokdonella sp.]|uniref:hypothetical protein n=1 Tax=Dokdonella sp. TaxID=2291710 RepID=UPI0025BC2D67|nr:hypothetical protein [Dokdonella sp.]MBX3701744.1 hypothetical protein [Dokdonella sp.]MCW5568307.1 hypothetical protein [Dokdonella sp.]MCW5578918.1 hypothetical protein [Dokdonella sp.]